MSSRLCCSINQQHCHRTTTNKKSISPGGFFPMRITDVRTIAVEVKLAKPVFDANYTMATKPALLVEIETDQGLVGLGEAAHFGGPMASTAQVIEHELREYLIDQDPRQIEYLWELMHRRAYKHARGGIVIAAISGIDIALWDLRGKMPGMPFAQLPRA